MCIRDRQKLDIYANDKIIECLKNSGMCCGVASEENDDYIPVSYTHLRAHETVLDLVCRLLLEKKTKPRSTTVNYIINNNTNTATL